MIAPKYEKNANSPGLANPATLKLLPLCVSRLGSDHINEMGGSDDEMDGR